jgi:small subunit ribosomal protein S20
VPNKASAAKRARQNLKRRARNRAARSTMKTTLKKAKDSLDQKQNVPEVLVQAQSVIAKTAKRGVIHPRKAARLTSRLMHKANKSAAQTESST